MKITRQMVMFYDISWDIHPSPLFCDKYYLL